MLNARTQQLAGLGALAVAAGLLGVYALIAYIAAPIGSNGIDRTNATIVWISVGLVIVALIAVHVALGRQLLRAAGSRATRA